MKKSLLAIFVVLGILLFSQGSASALCFSTTDGPWLENTRFDYSQLLGELREAASDGQADFTCGSDIYLARLFDWHHPTGVDGEPSWLVRLREIFDGQISMANMIQAGVRYRQGPGDRAPAPVPEPATMLLLGTGLLMFAGFGRKKSKRSDSDHN